MKRVLLLFGVLVVAWVLWSGYLTPLLLGLGLFSCLLTLVIARRTGFFHPDLYALRLSVRLLRYWLWLLGEIARSSAQVARIVLDPRLPISPTLVRIDTPGLDSFGQVMLGNSITLTPGTLTLDVDRGRLTVHALTVDGAGDLAGGSMQRRVTALGSTR